MAPSHPHEDLTRVLDSVVGIAAGAIAGASKAIGSTRLRRQGEPPGTGMEPDCAFYVGEHARGYYAARGEGDEALEAFVERTAPDLVVEVEVTNADEGKAERYGEMGVRELWRLHGHKGTRELRADFLALRAGNTPCRLDASEVLEGLTPDDVCEAVEEVRSSPNPIDWVDAARIVRRRQQASVRGHSTPTPFSASSMIVSP